MARKKQQPAASGFVLFDVFYQDGSRTSNRKVPSSEVGGLDGGHGVRHAVSLRAGRASRQ